MTFVAEYSLVFHPDPEIFPSRPASVGTSSHVIAKPSYPFPIYLGAELEPGTVLLARSQFEPESKAIAAYQSRIFDNSDHAKWSHVAIVGPDGLVWDTNPGANVQSRTLSDFVSEVDLVHARRIRRAEWNMEVFAEVLHEQSNSSYPQFASVRTLRYFFEYMAGKRLVSPPFNVNELICSSFVDRVIRESLSIEPFPEDAPPLALPGHFARTSAMECLPLAPNTFRLEDEAA